MNLTSNPAAEELEEVTIMGRTVYVSERSEKAYVELEDQLVSMTDLKSWNTLIERAKQEALPDYEMSKSMQHKLLEDKADQVADKIEEMAFELREEATSIRRFGADNGGRDD